MSAICQNTSLDSPIISCILNEAVDTWRNNHKPRNNRIKAIIYDLKSVNQFTDIPRQYSSFIQNFSGLLTSLKDDPLQEAVDDWMDVFHNSSTLVCVKTKNLIGDRASWAQIRRNLNDIKSHPKFKELLSIYSFRWFYEKLVIASARPKKVSQRHGELLNPDCELLNPGDFNPVYKKNLRSSLTFYVTSSFTLIKSITSGKSWLVPRESLLQLLDCATQRYTTLITSIYGESLNDLSLPRAEVLLWYFKWGDEILNIYFNEGYKSLKNWEPLITSFILTHEDDALVDTQVFKDYIRTEFINSQGDENRDDMIMRYNSLSQRLLEDSLGNPDILSQLFGLYRIWGHPVVDGLDGVNALRQITTHLHYINKHSVNIITRKWREYFSMSYYSKEKKWPCFTEESLTLPNFLSETIRNNRPLDTHHPLYSDSDWDNLVFSQTFEVPKKFEFTEMISDKATSLDAEELKERCERFGDIGKSESRSVIIRWLRCNENDPLDFLRRIGENGFTPNTKVCGVYPKEREGKNKPRLFGLMPLERRLYIVITEALIANFILKYFPEITMTFDQTTLLTRLSQVTKKLGHMDAEARRSIITNIDFEKWNSNMRDPETQEIFSDFDRLFGLDRVFSRSHELFTECTFYLADGSITPKWKGDVMEEGPGVWKNHYGGIEGLRQKGWTVFTVVILKYVCQQQQIPFQLLGQGDNQVLITHYYQKDNTTIRDQHKKFLNHLNIFLGTIGPPLKLEESWSSSLFLTYGKFPIFKGVPLSMSLKRLSRCSRLNNEGMVNLDSVLSSISANASAAISLSKNPLVSLLVPYFETYSAISLHLEYPFYGPELLSVPSHIEVRIPSSSGNQRLIDEQRTPFLKDLSRRHRNHLKLILCLTPSSLGGYPVPMLFDLMMHGFPDPVSAALWECKVTYQNLPAKYSSIRTGIVKVMNPRINEDKNPELLCQDPSCLNLLRGSRPKDQIKRMVFDYLTRVPGITNEAFLAFFETAQLQQKDLANLLFEMRPLHPRICASIYESTPIGVAQAITRRIQSTRTLEKMMIENVDHEVNQWTNLKDVEGELVRLRKPKDISELHYRFEDNQLMSIYLALNQTIPQEDPTEKCSTCWAHELRTISWGTELRGVTVAVPMELMTPCEGTGCSDHPNRDLGYIRCQSTLTTQTLPHAHAFIGPFKPFFGSSTSEKVKYEGGKLVKSSPPLLKTAMQNLRLINWGTDEASKLTKIITSVFESITDLDWRLLIPKQGGVTGTLEHRWADTKTEHGVSPSISYTVSTHFTVNTNLFKPELKDQDSDSDNVNVNHQSIFSLIAFDNLMNCLFQIGPLKTTHWHVNCRECIDYVNEDKIDLETDDSSVNEVVELLRDSEKNRFTWIPKEQFNLSLNHKSNYKVIPCHDYKGSWNLILTKTLVDWILVNNSISADKSQDWLYNERQLLVPISIVGKVNLGITLRSLAITMLLLVFYNKCAYWSNRIPPVSLTYALQVETRTLCNLSTLWFRPLISLFLTSDMCRLLAEELPMISPPKNCPPTELERAFCMKEIITEFLYNYGNPVSCQQFCLQWVKEVLVKSTCPVMHPEVLALLSIVLSGEDTGCQGMKYLAEMRKHQREIGASEWSNGMSILQEVFPEYKSDPLLLRCLALTQNCVLIESSPDYAARQVSRRTHPDTRIGSSKPIVINWSKVKKLPPATQHCFYNPKDLKNGTINNIKIPGMTSRPSSINHLYKSPFLITTAPYKLLSLISFIYQTKTCHLNHLRRILCCADGVGGFSALMCQLFPNAKVIYNSLYQVGNQSSVGCDSFVPAALVSKRVKTDQVVGIDDVIEQNSDITDRSWVQMMEAKYPSLDCIVSDAEGTGVSDISKLVNITKNLTLLSQATNTKLLIIKTYASRLDLVFCQLHWMYCAFRKVNAIRSFFSGYANTEVYLLASDLRSSPLHVEWVEMEGSMSLIGDIPTDLEIVNLIKRLQDLPYEYLSRPLADPYEDCLKINDKTYLPSPWRCYLDQVTEKKEIVFPTDIVKVLKEEFHLVKFSPQTKTHLRKHLLTLPIMKKLLIHYLLWVLWDAKDDERLRFERENNNLAFIVYETMSHSWSFTIDRHENRDYGRKWKAWRISSMTDQLFWKTFYSLLRESHRHIKNRRMNVTVKLCGADKYPYRVGLIIDHPDWKKRIGTDCTSVSNLPCPNKGDVLIVQSGLSSMEHSGELLVDDVPLLASLIQSIPDKEEKERFRAWLRKNKKLSPPHVKMEKIYRYYLNKFNLFVPVSSDTY